MSFILSLREVPPGRISLAGFTPDRLGGMSIAEIERLPLAGSPGQHRLGEFFKVAACAGDRLVFEGSDRRCSDIGAGMASGTCVVHGDVGDFLARDMRGGRLIVHGSTGNLAASGLSGGEVIVHGAAGDQLGGALPWLGGGMRGGRVIVHGNAGARCGDRMRRGEIFVAGDVGAFCAARMVAGSIAIGGTLGAHAGLAMRRGTLLLLDAAYEPAPTFVETVMCADAYLRLVWRDWVTRFDADDRFGAFARRAMAGGAPPRRWMGDLAADGRAEVFGFGA